MSNKLKFLEQLEYSKGVRVILDTPLRRTKITKTFEPVDKDYPELGHIIDQRIILASRTRVPGKVEDKVLELLNNRATVMFAREIYGEVCDELFEILLYVHENYFDIELANKIEELLGKMKP